MTRNANEICRMFLYTWWIWLRSGGIIDQCNETFHLRFQLLNGFADLRVVIHIAVTNHAFPVAGFGERFGAIRRKCHSHQCEKTKHRVHFERLVTPLRDKTKFCAEVCPKRRVMIQLSSSVRFLPGFRLNKTRKFSCL